MLQRGVHDNIHLQRAWDKDGEAAFVFETLSYCNPDALISNEQWWVDYYRKNNTSLYNLRPVVNSQLGYRMSDESRARMSIAQRKMTEETKKKIGAANRKYALEHREELLARSAHRKGKPLTDECKAKLRGRVPWNKGKTGTVQFSDKARAKMRAARAGKRPGLGRKCSPQEIERRTEAIRAAHARKTPEERSAIGYKIWETRRRNSAPSL